MHHAHIIVIQNLENVGHNLAKKHLPVLKPTGTKAAIYNRYMPNTDCVGSDSLWVSGTPSMVVLFISCLKFSQQNSEYSID